MILASELPIRGLDLLQRGTSRDVESLIIISSSGLDDQTSTPWGLRTEERRVIGLEDWVAISGKECRSSGAEGGAAQRIGWKWNRRVGDWQDI